MKTLQDIKRVLKSHKKELGSKYGVKEIGIFGSYVKEEQKETSDVDILVEFEKPLGLLDFVGLKNYLSLFAFMIPPGLAPVQMKK